MSSYRHMYGMYFIKFVPTLSCPLPLLLTHTPLCSQIVPFLTSCLFCVCDPVSFIRFAFRSMDNGLSIEAWATYQWLHCRRKFLSFPNHPSLPKESQGGAWSRAPLSLSKLLTDLILCRLSRALQSLEII